jgi:hypothetical protein
MHAADDVGRDGQVRSTGEVARICADDGTQDLIFAGPGETRAPFRPMDWSATTVGPVRSWSSEPRWHVRRCRRAGRRRRRLSHQATPDTGAAGKGQGELRVESAPRTGHRRGGHPRGAAPQCPGQQPDHRPGDRHSDGDAPVVRRSGLPAADQGQPGQQPQAPRPCGAGGGDRSAPVQADRRDNLIIRVTTPRP